MSTTTIAVVAPGAMGAGIGARLTETGARVIASTAGRSEMSLERARAARMEPATDQELARADLFLSVVPPANALALAERMAETVRGVGARPVYIDLNAISPRSTAQVQAIVEATGATFVDGGIIGAPPAPGTQGPILYLSGPVGGAAERLARHGLRVEVVAGGIGAASALKLCYAGINKGLIALGACMVLAAERAGVGEALRNELSRSQPAVLAQLDRGVPGMLPKAYRWGPEMREIADLIGGDGVGAPIYDRMSDLYERVAADLGSERELASTLARWFGSAGG